VLAGAAGRGAVPAGAAGRGAVPAGAAGRGAVPAGAAPGVVPAPSLSSSAGMFGSVTPDFGSSAMPLLIFDS
jgi:hypothetical protein